jgi:hypothetical protein
MEGSGFGIFSFGIWDFARVISYSGDFWCAVLKF